MEVRLSGCKVGVMEESKMTDKFLAWTMAGWRCLSLRGHSGGDHGVCYRHGEFKMIIEHGCGGHTSLELSRDSGWRYMLKLKLLEKMR